MRGLEVSQEAEGTMTAFESARGNLNKKRSDEQSAFKGSQKEEAMRRLNAKGVVSTKQVHGGNAHLRGGGPASARALAGALGVAEPGFEAKTNWDLALCGRVAEELRCSRRGVVEQLRVMTWHHYVCLQVAEELWRGDFRQNKSGVWFYTQ